MDETLRMPDALLHYEVRGNGPLVVLVGAPMDATSFEPLAELLSTDHTVLTTDPRGINRSKVDDPDRDSTPELRAADLAALITHVDAGPAAVLGSSGGAVSALALVQAHPELVGTAIAHEPPLIELLEDRLARRAEMEDVVETHAAGDVLGAWRKFMAQAGFDMPEEVFQEAFGGPRTPQETADDAFQHAHMLRPTAAWHPDFSLLRSVSTRVAVGIGEQSAGQLCERTSNALAAALRVEPVRFPGGHVGFLEDPAAFAACLRDVLR